MMFLDDGFRELFAPAAQLVDPFLRHSRKIRRIGSFVRKAAARAAADDLYLYGGGLTPELAALIERTFRGVHLLAYLKQEELAGADRGALFDRAAEDARAAQIKVLGTDDESAER